MLQFTRKKVSYQRGNFMLKRSILLSLRIPNDMLDMLENTVKEGKFENVSKAIRSYVELGMHVESLKSMIKDPVFLKSIEELKQTEGLFQWTETLKDNEVDAIASALKFEKEKRYENGTLR